MRNWLPSRGSTRSANIVQGRELSHQLPGELSLKDRAEQAGIRFSALAENVAQGFSAAQIHSAWMRSAHHRDNILDPVLTAVGIAVANAGENTLYAVEDFSLPLERLSFAQQEERVEKLLSEQGLHILARRAEARQACSADRNSANVPARTTIHFEASDLRIVPDEVLQKIRAGRSPHGLRRRLCSPRFQGPEPISRRHPAILRSHAATQFPVPKSVTGSEGATALRWSNP